MVFALIPPMSDADGGAFFGFLGVAFALVAASGFFSFLLKLKNNHFFRHWSSLWHCQKWDWNQFDGSDET